MTPLHSVDQTTLQLKQAIATQDHQSSLQILKQLPLKKRWETLFLLQRSFASNPGKNYVQALAHDILYRAYQAEIAGQQDEASRLYRLLIQRTTGKKVTQKAREGYQRIANGTPSTASPTVLPTAQALAGTEIGLIVIEPVASSQKKALAVEFAKILKTDPYTARLALPSLECRIFRYGIAQETNPLHQTLTSAGIPNRHIALSAIQSIPVHDVLYIESAGDQLTVQVRDQTHPNQSNSMTLNWSDIGQRVNGLLPLFEEVINRNNKGKITRKTETQDHAQICDLHLKDNQGILRLYDAGYQFNQGISLVNPDARMTLETKTSWAQWQGLKTILAKFLPPIPEYQKFDHFATTTVEQIEILTHIKAQINLLRRHECYWDQAFHLYSALHYLNQS